MPLFSGTHLQVRRGLAQGCAFLGIFHIAPHLGGQNPPKLPILGCEQAFSSQTREIEKRVYCTVIKTTKCPSWVVPTHALQIQDGGRPPSWKNRRIAIFRPRFNRFSRNLANWCSSNPLAVPAVKNLKFWKSKMAAAAILKNLKIAISRPRYNRFWRNLARWCSSAMLTAPRVNVAVTSHTIIITIRISKIDWLLLLQAIPSLRGVMAWAAPLSARPGPRPWRDKFTDGLLDIDC